MTAAVLAGKASENTPARCRPERGKASFVNKKKQKNFFLLGHVGGNARDPAEIKVFAPLFRAQIRLEPSSLMMRALTRSLCDEFTTVASFAIASSILLGSTPADLQSASVPDAGAPHRAHGCRPRAARSAAMPRVDIGVQCPCVVRRHNAQRAEPDCGDAPGPKRNTLPTQVRGFTLRASVLRHECPLAWPCFEHAFARSRSKACWTVTGLTRRSRISWRTQGSRAPAAWSAASSRRC